MATSSRTVRRLFRAPAQPLRAGAVVCALALVLLGAARSRAVAVEFAPSGEPFQRTWARTDQPVAAGVVQRTWMWGPEAFTDAFREPYVEGHDNSREVQYFDKSRMEITTDQSVPYDSPWFVTNGLLARELMTGQEQLGNVKFEQHNPSQAQVAGDPDSAGPTYAAFGRVMSAPAATTGATLTATLDATGNVGASAALAAYGVTAAQDVPMTGHTVASVFWDFMNAQGTVYENNAYVTDNLFPNPYYATGYPLTEAYWVTIKLDNVPTQVLAQCFERRCLTYTPSNPAGWQVEAGNVGRHYYQWRYTEIPSEGTPTATPVTPSPSSSPSPSPSPSPSATATGTPNWQVGSLEIETINAALPGDATAQKEDIVIRNMQQAGPIDMAGWQLRDEDGNVFTFPDVTVLAGFYVDVHVCSGEDIIGDNYAVLYWGLCRPFYTPPETISLVDPFGTVIDTYPTHPTR